MNERPLVALAALAAVLPWLAAATAAPSSGESQAAPGDTARIHVDLDRPLGELDHVWAWLGYDEPNYTYMPQGRKLLDQMADAMPVPVHVRAHNLLTSGDGEAGLKWGSTNAYTEDAGGAPVYDWTLVDSIFDRYVERGMRPLVEIGFMPEDLSSRPEPYRHRWAPNRPYREIYTGWAHPPDDWDQWAGLVYQWVLHSVDRYGAEEVETWHWEPWNEPDIGYWQGTTEEYLKLYDYTVDAVLRALPGATVGGPHTTGPGHEGGSTFLRAFLDHVTSGVNYRTGGRGSPINFVAFHAKGSPRIVDGHVRMDLGRQLRDIAAGFDIATSYPSLRDLPIVIGESDPEGCAACSVADNPHNAYRNGTLYASYTAAAFPRKIELADRTGANFLGAVTWAFQFENQPWFAGFRSLATNGVAKPVLGVFRMFGMMSGQRVVVTGGTGYDATRIVEGSVRAEPDVHGFAARDEGTATVLLWNYHDDDLAAPAAPVAVTVAGVPAGRVRLHHYRIDREHSNSYEVWKEMGSPQEPTPEEYARLEATSELALLEPPRWIETAAGTAVVSLSLPRQGVSLLRLTWGGEASRILVPEAVPAQQAPGGALAPVTPLQGTLERIVVHGASLESNLEGDSPDRPVSVYLPPSYASSPQRRYPVVYVLHGFTDDDVHWFGWEDHFVNVPAAFERALEAGTAEEMVLVMPNAYTAYAGSMYSNSVTTGDWERYVAEELVAHIDRRYRTIPERPARGLTGHSMGGYGTLRIGMKRPDVFSAIYAMSPCCLEPRMEAAGLERAEAVTSPEAVLEADFRVKAAFASAAAWSPNPHRPPFFLDLPTRDGEPMPDVLARWVANAPLAMVHQYVPNLRALSAIALDSGAQDGGITRATREMDRILTLYGIPHGAEIYDPGNHVSHVDGRVERHVLPFFSRHLRFESGG